MSEPLAEGETAVSALESLLEDARSSPVRYIDDFIPDEDRVPDGIWESFVGEYRAVVVQVAETWGQPDFDGGWEDPGFPDWHHWVPFLAFWFRDAAVAYVECDHQDNELPVTLALGAKIPSDDGT